MAGSAVAVGTCLVAAATGVWVSGIQPEVQPKSRYSGLEAHETHAAASLLGQFRTSLSGWLWYRADLYLHNGVVMRPLTEQELALGQAGVGGADDHHEDDLHDDGTIVTVIPAKQSDFRGVLGDLERETKAFKDMSHHEHNPPQQALPLYRLMTWADPGFTNAWVTGASVMSMGHRHEDAQKAIAFLNEGLKSNPDSMAIFNQLGYTFLVKLGRVSQANAAFERAIESGDAVKLPLVSESEQESLLNAYRWKCLLERELGHQAKMMATAKKGLELFPGDAPLERAANPAPTPLTPKAQAEYHAK